MKNNRLKTMNCITVLDFETGYVHQYDIGFQVNKLGWNPDVESCEEYLTSKGHNLKNINWMVHSNEEIITK